MLYFVVTIELNFLIISWYPRLENSTQPQTVLENVQNTTQKFHGIQTPGSVLFHTWNEQLGVMFQPWTSVWKEEHEAPLSNGERFLITNGDLDIHARINRELSDLANSLGWRLKIDHTLVDAHLVTIPGLWTFTIWRLTSGNTQGLSWHADWALDLEKILYKLTTSSSYLQVLVLSSLDELIGNALDSRAVLRSDGDSNFMLLLLSRG